MLHFGKRGHRNAGALAHLAQGPAISRPQRAQQASQRWVTRIHIHLSRLENDVSVGRSQHTYRIRQVNRLKAQNTCSNAIWQIDLYRELR
jgi:hypothetical protein